MKRNLICWLLAWACGFLCACCLLGCGGTIDLAGAVRVESASGTWAVEQHSKS